MQTLVEVGKTLIAFLTFVAALAAVDWYLDTYHFTQAELTNLLIHARIDAARETRQRFVCPPPTLPDMFKQYPKKRT